MGEEKPILNKMVTLRNYGVGTGYTSDGITGEKTEFEHDEKIYACHVWDDLTGGEKFEIKWYLKVGVSFKHRLTHTWTNTPNYKSIYQYAWVQNKTPGEWLVRFYGKGIFAGGERFTIKEEVVEPTKPATMNFNPSRDYNYMEAEQRIWQYFSEHDEWYVYNHDPAVPSSLIVTTAQWEAIAGVPEVRKIIGHVTDASTGAPIFDAVVDFVDKSDRTDLSGYYEIIDPLKISAIMKVQAAGYIPQEKAVTSPITGTLTVNFSLTLIFIPPLPEETPEFWEEKGYTHDEAVKIAAWSAENQMTPTPAHIEEAILGWSFLSWIRDKAEETFNNLQFLSHTAILLFLESLSDLEEGESILDNFAEYSGNKFLDELVKEDPEYEVLRDAPKGSISILAILGLAATILGVGTVIGWLRKEGPEPMGMAVWAAIEAAQAPGATRDDWVRANAANQEYKNFITQFNTWLITIASWLNPILGWYIGKNKLSQLASADTYQGIIDPHLLIFEGTLKITAEPADAKITVEGKIPATGIFEQVLEVGDYEVVVSAFGYEPQTFTATIEADKETTFNIILELVGAPLGTLKIEAEPLDAKITVEGQIPATGIFNMELPVGEYKVIVSAFDYEPQEKTLTVIEGQETYEKFILSKIPLVELPEIIETTVRDIIDGDTIDTSLDYNIPGEVETHKLPEYENTGHGRVRIVGINAPEKSPKGEILCTDIEVYEVEPKYADLSRDILLPLNDKKVTLYIDPEHRADTYGRILARVEYAGEDVGLEQIKRGYACWYFRETNKYIDDDLYKLETLRAREDKTGMWEAVIPLPGEEILFTINSTPERAEVWIDGVYTHHLTPTHEIEQKDVIYLWTEGKHILKLLKSGYEREEEITLVKGERLEISWDLTELPPPPTCEELTTQEECEAAGCFWYDGACHSEEKPVEPPPEEPDEKDLLIAELRIAIEELNATIKILNDRIAELEGIPPKICEEHTTQAECEAAGCYWYDGVCHLEPKPPPGLPSTYTSEQEWALIEAFSQLWDYIQGTAQLSAAEFEVFKEGYAMYSADQKKVLDIFFSRVLILTKGAAQMSHKEYDELKEEFRL